VDRKEAKLQKDTEVVQKNTAISIPCQTFI